MGNRWFLVVSALLLVCACAKQQEMSLIESVDLFQVSECQENCGIDSVGTLRNETRNRKLHIRIGNIVNCSFKQAFLKNATQKNDTLILDINIPNIENEGIPIHSCDCFFYFDLIIKNRSIAPKTIRVVDFFEEGTFWDEHLPVITIEIEDVEVIEIED